MRPKRCALRSAKASPRSMRAIWGCGPSAATRAGSSSCCRGRSRRALTRPGLVYALGHRFAPVEATRAAEGQVLGLSVSSPAVLEEAIPYALDAGFDMLLLDGSAGLGTPWAELTGRARPHDPAGCRGDPAPAGPRGGDRPRLLRRRALGHRCGQGDRPRHRRRGAGGGRRARRRRRHHRQTTSSRSRPTAATRTGRQAPPTSSRRPPPRPR